MDADIAAYLADTFEKIKQIKANDKGEVWLALGKAGQPVIIKHIFLTGLPYKALQKQAPSICPHIRQCIEADEETVVVEEFVPGESLAELVRGRRYLTESEAKNFLLQLCEGLAPIHAAGIIHRDIKPSNLIVQPGGMLRLIDFDAARTVKEDSHEDTKLLGTKGYAPPEQFGYGQTDARSDIYAIGVTMQKLLGDDYQGGLTKILQKCTQFDPQQRYSSVTALRQAILWQSKRKKLVLFAGAAVIIALCGSLMSRPQSVDKPITIPPTANVTKSADNAEPVAVETHTPIHKAQVQKQTVTAESNNSVNSSLPDTVSETPLPITETEPVPAMQAPLPSTVPTPMGNIEATFYLNGATYNNTPTPLTLTGAEWPNQEAQLHIVNNSNTVWEQPTIRILFADNWGQKKTEEHTLPPLAPNESADLTIPIADFNLTRNENYPTEETSAWVQVYLSKGTVPLNESYWCIQYTVTP